MTPEGRVKAAVKKVLAPFVARQILWGDWPVPGGYGKSSLDYIGCINGVFFSIETKAPGKHPTVRQNIIAHAIDKAGGIVFVIGEDPKTLHLELTMLQEFLTLQGNRTPDAASR